MLDLVNCVCLSRTARMRSDSSYTDRSAGSLSCAFVSPINLKRRSASSCNSFAGVHAGMFRFALSGWYLSAKLRYAFLMSDSDALLFTAPSPIIRYMSICALGCVSFLVRKPRSRSVATARAFLRSS